MSQINIPYPYDMVYIEQLQIPRLMFGLSIIKNPNIWFSKQICETIADHSFLNVSIFYLVCFITQ